jgi:hypothetical protein
VQVRLGEGHENKAREDEVAGQLVVLVDGDQGLHLPDKGSSSGSQPGVLLSFEVSSSRCRLLSLVDSPLIDLEACMCSWRCQNHEGQLLSADAF